MTKNVKEIIKNYLFVTSKVGLVSEKYGCECSKENLMPCKKKDISKAEFVKYFLNTLLIFHILFY